MKPLSDMAHSLLNTGCSLSTRSLETDMLRPQHVEWEQVFTEVASGVIQQFLLVIL